MVYLNSNRPLLINTEIIEWDIKSANLSVIKEFSMLPDKEIDKISTMEKSKRVKYVGIIMRDDKSFGKALEDNFNKVVESFMSQNSLDKEYDVLSIKKDAVFVIAKAIKHPIVGRHVLFVPKNDYHSYLQLHPYEFYFKNKSIDVKGLSDSLLPLHEKGILYFLKYCVDTCASSNMNKDVINNVLHDFVEAYKNKELDFDFYREFNAISKFKCNMFGNELLMESIDESMLQYVNIEFNYLNIILPIIRLLC